MTMSRSLSLEPCTFHLKWKKQFSFPRTHTFRTSISIPNIKSHNNAAIKLKFKCHLNQNHNSNSKPLLESLATTIWNTLRKPAVAAILLIGILLLTTYNPNTSLAAPSGGRMGGSAFSKSSSSRSYSAPSSSSSSSWSRRSYSRVPSPPSPEFSYSDEPPLFWIDPADINFNLFIHVIAAISTLLLMNAFMVLILVSVSRFLSDSDEGSVLTNTAAVKTTVLKLQVGLLGTVRSLQRDLNRIAEVADTSSPEGLNYILTETSLALIRHLDYCISGYSSITILAAAEGEHKLPSINGSGKLKEALQKLVSIPSSKLLAVEVLWTPQDENDTLLERELLEDYPLLQPL
ncbi:plant/F20D21-34 protein [Medicago truncatula]|uniref:Plant/F20D21-34 protein n=1 Tax=Medicago truncatula TaxID=3880 RepID=A0A072TP13_MEDTR|nr:plant/F20D21-34 protein [Medicago truncatula]